MLDTSAVTAPVLPPVKMSPVDRALATRIARGFVNGRRKLRGYAAWADAEAGEAEPACRYGSSVSVWLSRVRAADGPRGWVWVSGAKVGPAILGYSTAARDFQPVVKGTQLIDVGKDFFQRLAEIMAADPVLADALPGIVAAKRATDVWGFSSLAELANEVVAGVQEIVQPAIVTETTRRMIEGVRRFNNVYDGSDPGKNCWLGPSQSILHFYDDFAVNAVGTTLLSVTPREIHTKFKEYEDNVFDYHYSIAEILHDLANSHALQASADNHITVRAGTIHTPTEYTSPSFGFYTAEIDARRPVFVSPRSLAVDLGEQWNRTGYGYQVEVVRYSARGYNFASLVYNFAVCIHPNGAGDPYDENWLWWGLCAAGGNMVSFVAESTSVAPGLVCSYKNDINPWTEPDQDLAVGLALEPGQSADVTTYLYNTGNVALNVYYSIPALPAGVTTQPEFPTQPLQASGLVVTLEAACLGVQKITVTRGSGETGGSGGFDIDVTGIRSGVALAEAVTSKFEIGVTAAAVLEPDAQQLTIVTGPQDEPLGALVSDGTSVAQRFRHTGSQFAGVALPLFVSHQGTGSSLIVEVKDRLDAASPKWTTSVGASSLPTSPPSNPEAWWKKRLNTVTVPPLALAEGDYYLVLRVPGGSSNQYGCGANLATTDAYSGGEVSWTTASGWQSTDSVPELAGLHWDLAFRVYRPATTRARPTGGGATSTSRAVTRGPTTSAARPYDASGLLVARTSFTTRRGIPHFPRATSEKLSAVIANKGTVVLRVDGQAVALPAGEDATLNVSAVHSGGTKASGSASLRGSGTVSAAVRLAVDQTSGGFEIPGRVLFTCNVAVRSARHPPFVLVAQRLIDVIPDHVAARRRRA